MIAVAALRREHSLGAHCRIDFPSAPAPRERSRLTLADAFAEARGRFRDRQTLARRA